jgi:hypothetical protein
MVIKTIQRGRLTHLIGVPSTMRQRRQRRSAPSLSTALRPTEALAALVFCLTCNLQCIFSSTYFGRDWRRFEFEMNETEDPSDSVYSGDVSRKLYLTSGKIGLEKRKCRYIEAKVSLSQSALIFVRWIRYLFMKWRWKERENYILSAKVAPKKNRKNARELIT